MIESELRSGIEEYVEHYSIEMALDVIADCCRKNAERTRKQWGKSGEATAAALECLADDVDIASEAANNRGL